MNCPICNATFIKVLQTRESGSSNALRRRRLCANNHRITTYERVDYPRRADPQLVLRFPKLEG